MTGTSLAPIVIPIVTASGLAAWLLLLAYAVSHPQWGHGAGRARHGAGAAPAHRRLPRTRPAPPARPRAVRGKIAATQAGR